MNWLRLRYYRFILWISGATTAFQVNRSFFGMLFNLSIKGTIFSLIGTALLVVSDKLYLLLLSRLLHSNADTTWCYLALFLSDLNSKFHIWNLDYFADTISIGAGVLGVLLGLFYTAFLTIVATKYSNINTVISVQLLEQKTLNKYFTLLSSITALSFIFQFLLAFGYEPSVVSSLLYLLLVIFTIASFTNYGRTLHIYFDPSTLAIDILNDCHHLLNEAVKHKRVLSKINMGKSYVHRIYHQIDKIETIIEESKNPQVSNTSLNIISGQLNRFSQYLLSQKHRIPADKNWHIEVVKHKSWEDAKEWDLNLVKTTGVDMLRENVTSHFEIEKKIIETQFLLFGNYVSTSEKLDVVIQQVNFVSQLAFQCDNNVFELYFEKLEALLLEKISNAEDVAYRLQLASLYPHLVIQYFVGFNYFLEKFDPDELKSAAHAIHHFKSTDSFTIPYFIRVSGDEYQQKLRKEIEIEGKVITREFYSEFEFGHVMQYTLQSHYEFAVKFITGKVTGIIKKLTEKNALCALLISMDSIELQRKMNLFARNLKSSFELFNELNFQGGEVPFEFKSFERTMEDCENFNQSIINSIWTTGISSYDLERKELPDIFGKYYQIVMDDLVGSLLKLPLDVTLLENRIEHYLRDCLLYIHALRKRHGDPKNIDFFALRLYPVITDLFEVEAIIFIVSRAQRSEKLVNILCKFWDSLHKTAAEELEFWKFIYAIYTYCKSPRFSLSTNSYIKEHERNLNLLEYLTKNQIFVEESVVESKLFPIVDRTVSKIDDYYLEAIASSIHPGSMNNIDLDEVFIEVFLKGRTALKELNIKETRYGQRIR